MLQQLKAQLKQSQNSNECIREDLYTHMCELFNRIIQFHPHDAFDRFEEISILIKATNLKIQDPKYDYEINGMAGRRAQVSKNEILGFIERAKRLLREDPEIKGVDRNLLTRDQLFNIPNLESHSEMF